MSEDRGGNGGSARDIEARLSEHPPVVVAAFRSAREVLAERVDEETLDAWAACGAEIAGASVRSWEAAAEYFQASPAVQRQLPSGQFVRWGASGARLCAESPGLGATFFRASPDALLRLRPRHIDSWARLCHGMYRGTWKSSALACHFCESAPGLLASLSFPEFVQFGEFLEAISRRSYDLAEGCLTQGEGLFGKLGRDSEPFIQVAGALAENAWREVKEFFDVACGVLPDMESRQRKALLSLTGRLALAGQAAAGPFLRDAVGVIGQLPVENQRRTFELAEGLAGVDPAAVPDFVRSIPRALERVTFPQLEEWHGEGAAILRENADAGQAYFRIDSARSRGVLETLSSGVELVEVGGVVRMYCQALAGRGLEVQASQQLVEKKIGWVEEESPTTEGTTIFLPRVVNRFPAKDENFSWYKVVATHQAGHIEFGSFDFDFGRGSTLFEDLREEIASRAGAGSASVRPAGEDAAGEDGGDPGPATEMSRFFKLFPDNSLGLDVFTVVEDTRLDARIVHEYRGIAEAYGVAQGHSLAGRTAIEQLPMREALLEFMVRLSLHQKTGLKAPREHVERARKIARIMLRVRLPDCTVEDSAEAAVRIYALLAEVPNASIDEDEFEEIDPERDEASGGDEEMPGDFLERFAGGGEAGEGEGDGAEEPYESPEDVDYRGEFKPELAQLLSLMALDRLPGDGEEGRQLTPEQLQALLANSAELEIEPGEGDEQEGVQADEILENLMKELARRDPDNSAFTQGPLVHVEEDGGPLSPSGADQYVYDEWDFRANERKPRWCIVHEKRMAEGETTFYDETLVNYASLVRGIRRQFQLVIPEMYRKVKRLEDGEEHDLDSVIEAITDLRTGSTPSDKLWWRRNKVERSVAVAFLLDMSASTAEAIDEAKRATDEWAAPDDPVQYMTWLRSRRADGLRRSYKRIIDVEKESIALLIDALEAIGDTYGVYGFSGYGRENVEFYVIKDFDEKFSESVARRIDRIAPLHATRMGPAIRHATTKLAQEDAKSRFMFLISDGRPQDRGYSREGVEKEYAVHDTRMALVEAKEGGIVPFCLTVDRAGHDYLKTMMQDFSYEVLPEIALLPKRLPQLYRRLTM